MADKGYGYPAVRGTVRRRGYTAHILSSLVPSSGLIQTIPRDEIV